jgi:Intra-flagellar transport protein 57.
MLAYYSDESDDDAIFKLNDNRISTTRGEQLVIENLNIDEDQWRLEVERVQPRLKVTVRNDARDWRSNLEQIKQYRNAITGNLEGTKVQLEKIQKDVAFTMEKIGNRERYLNRELGTILDEYRGLQDQLSKVKEEYQGISGGVVERTRKLATLTDKLEVIKREMDERGSSMTDGSEFRRMLLITL